MPQSDNLIAYYDGYDEQGRLGNAWGQVEFVRTQAILTRSLPPTPAVILDVGGAAGRYACWLANLGYSVHLVDPVPLHIKQALQASARQPDHPITTCTVGDARQLEFDNASADVVLMLGPLYHLTERAERLQALREAWRVLKPGGMLFAAGISRFASTLDGLAAEFYLDPDFQTIMRNDLATGQHRNPTGKPQYFMDTFFHHPDELRAEVLEAGFTVDALLAIEGISYMMKDFAESWHSEERRSFLLDILSKIESEPTLMGASPHILCVGKKGR